MSQPPTLKPRSISALAPSVLSHRNQVTSSRESDSQSRSQPSKDPRQTISAKYSSEKALPTKELVIITTQLCILVKSGLDLTESLRSISRRVRHPRTRAALRELWQNIEGGLSFSEAVNRQKHHFGPTFAATVSAGEASGQLPNVLDRLRELLRSELKLRNSVRSILVYPAVLVCVGALVLAAMVFFVLPQFTKVYRVMGRPAPMLTQLLLDAGTVCRTWWWVIVPSAAIGIFCLYKICQLPSAIRWRDRQMLYRPVASPVLQHLLTGRVFTLIGTMLHSGVPLLEAMKLAANTVGNALFQDLFNDLEDEILAGRPMAPILEQSQCVPDGTAELIETAESSGDLGGVLQSIGDFYQEEGEQKLRSVMKLIEPAIIVGMGVVVASIVMSIMLPLIKLTSIGGR